jgi:hypothetical protein
MMMALRKFDTHAGLTHPAHHRTVDDERVLDRFVLLEILEPLLLHAGHVQHVRRADDLVQRPVLVLDRRRSTDCLSDIVWDAQVAWKTQP